MIEYKVKVEEYIITWYLNNLIHGEDEPVITIFNDYLAHVVEIKALQDTQEYRNILQQVLDDFDQGIIPAPDFLLSFKNKKR